MLRREVLKCYKDILKTVYKIEDKMYKTYLINWTRSDFKANKTLNDEVLKLFKLFLFNNFKDNQCFFRLALKLH